MWYVEQILYLTLLTMQAIKFAIYYSTQVKVVLLLPHFNSLSRSNHLIHLYSSKLASQIVITCHPSHFINIFPLGYISTWIFFWHDASWWKGTMRHRRTQRHPYTSSTHYWHLLLSLHLIPPHVQLVFLLSINLIHPCFTLTLTYVYPPFFLSSSPRPSTFTHTHRPVALNALVSTFSINH